nr:hypothetical protein [Pyxidicoccus fallax]
MRGDTAGTGVGGSGTPVGTGDTRAGTAARGTGGSGSAGAGQGTGGEGTAGMGTAQGTGGGGTAGTGTAQGTGGAGTETQGNAQGTGAGASGTGRGTGGAGTAGTGQGTGGAGATGRGSAPVVSDVPPSGSNVPAPSGTQMVNAIYTGEVRSVSGNQVVIGLETGAPLVLDVDARTRVFRNGRGIGVRQLEKGEQVRAVVDLVGQDQTLEIAVLPAAPRGG